MTNNYWIQIESVDDVKKIGTAGDSKPENEMKRRGRPRKQVGNGPADGSKGELVPMNRLPRKQAENGPVDGSEWASPPKPEPYFDEEGHKIKPSITDIAEYFTWKHRYPPLVFSGSQAFKYDSEIGWNPCSFDEARNIMAQFLVQDKDYQDYGKKGNIGILEVWSKAIWNIPPHLCKGCFIEMNNPWEGGSFKDVNKTPRMDISDGSGWIACRNALINTRTGETREFSQGLFTVGRVPCDYDPAADCPRWKQFLKETLDPDSAVVLQEFFGVSLTFDRSFQGFAILYGEGGNGKGVVCEILKTLNAGAACAVSLAGLGDKFSRFPLTVNRVNIHPDTNSRINKNQIPEMEEILKAGAVGESVWVEKKGVDGETRPLVALMVFAMNPPLPAFLDNSQGINRRIRVIHFQKTFAGTPGENNHLKDDLKQELPGILNWALEGYRRLIDSGAKQFSDSEAGRRIVLESRKLNHPEETFFDEFLTVTPNGLVSSRKVYDRYRKWTEETGNKFPMAENKFSARLLAYFQKTGAQVQKERRRNLHYFTGLELEGDLEGF